MFLNEWGGGGKLELPAENFLKQLVPSGFFQVTQGPSSGDLDDLTVFHVFLSLFFMKIYRIC